MKAWGFTYKSNIVWYKTRKDGGPDGRGVGFYFRNVTELLLFGVHGRLRTLAPGRRQVNIMLSQKREHSRKPDEQYSIIETCSAGPFLELFARGQRSGWKQWGNQAESYAPTWPTYANHSKAERSVRDVDKQAELILHDRVNRKASSIENPLPRIYGKPAAHRNRRVHTQTAA